MMEEGLSAKADVALRIVLIDLVNGHVVPEKVNMFLCCVADLCGEHNVMCCGEGSDKILIRPYIS